MGDEFNKRRGQQTIELKEPPRIISTFSIVGPKEGEGPLKHYFDEVLKDDTCGEESYEKAESEMMYKAIGESIKKAGLTEKDINYLFSGDLLNQIISSTFAARKFKIPFFGLYGACSTMSESLSLGALLVDGGFADYVVAATSSHFSSAERQFRFPLNYGAQRSKTAQWTVTGAGAMVLGRKGEFPKVRYITTGVVKDYGITDPSNMGAAMAPAAAHTIYKHFKDTGREPKDYDLIATGDLGRVGKKIANELLLEYGYDIKDNHIDCGDMIFNDVVQNTESGGSGCGCSAVVASGYLYKKLMTKEVKKVLLVSTGALMSTTSSLQGESIPGIAHAVSIEFD
ncbi:stage V sporulation protein AD [Clostridium sp. HBUAS56017]|uniref:stage V sporulation protein AD n=1 Tax=Clostridium sp. HBUAS56017 TaxID=2571128 RepID=UPI0011783369|nr:stage V sporulation protein AD [Clostridium sp. HBUAS56017]